MVWYSMIIYGIVDVWCWWFLVLLPWPSRFDHPHGHPHGHPRSSAPSRGGGTVPHLAKHASIFADDSRRGDTRDGQLFVAWQETKLRGLKMMNMPIPIDVPEMSYWNAVSVCLRDLFLFYFSRLNLIIHVDRTSEASMCSGCYTITCYFKLIGFLFIELVLLCNMFQCIDHDLMFVDAVFGTAGTLEVGTRCIRVYIQSARYTVPISMPVLVGLPNFLTTLYSIK